MREALVRQLHRARELGFVGPGAVEPHVEHAHLFVRALEHAPPGTVVDLGSGGGLPALVVLAHTDRRVVLVESHGRRAQHLLDAVAELGVAERAEVVHDRAETAAATRRGDAAVVTARAFGPPAVTAECAAPFLTVGGWLVVSEPPGPPDDLRWPASGLAELGLEPARRMEAPTGALQVLHQVQPAPGRYPRRVGVAAKRPLF